MQLIKPIQDFMFDLVGRPHERQLLCCMTAVISRLRNGRGMSRGGTGWLHVRSSILEQRLVALSS
jgi:hypothetical protein